MEIKTPVLDREINKRIGQVKRAQTRLRRKQEELARAQGASANTETVSQLMRERGRLALGVARAMGRAESFVSGLNSLLEWRK